MKNRVQSLFPRIFVPIVREFLVPAVCCAFALILAGTLLDVRAEAAGNDNENNPAVHESIHIAENGELTLDGRRTHVWPGTGTTKQWLAGLTVGRDTIVAEAGWFKVYRDGKLVTQIECALTGDGFDPYDDEVCAFYDRTITKYASADKYPNMPAEVPQIVVFYLYDYRTLWDWYVHGDDDGRLKEYPEIKYSEYFQSQSRWTFIYEDELYDPNTVRDNVVHLSGDGSADHILARSATVIGGDNGFLEVRFFVEADDDHPTNDPNTTGYAYDHYIDLKTLAETGKHEWYDRYSNAEVWSKAARGEWYDPIPHRRWEDNHLCGFLAAYKG